MDVGRVFFHYQPGTTRLRQIEVLTLQSHTGNVARLAELWDPERAYLRLPAEVDLTRTREKLIEAARRHDEAKPQRFRLERDAQTGRYSYSYRGHRFIVQADDLYISLLIRLHHEFSVNGITMAIARLRRAGDLQGALNFPFDLYALEMCDQIAAEVESRAFGDKTGPERVFMEFHLFSPDDRIFHVDPYPFREPRIRLTLTYIPYVPSSGDKDPERLTDRLRTLSPDQKQCREVEICPL